MSFVKFQLSVSQVAFMIEISHCSESKIKILKSYRSDNEFENDYIWEFIFMRLI